MLPRNYIFYIAALSSIVVESKRHLRNGTFPNTRHRVHNTSLNIQGKIVGGQPVLIEHYSFAAQFLNLGGLCGGVIIHSWAIATSAHCLDLNKNVEDMVIQAGARYAYDYKSESYDVSSFVIHEDYNKEQVFQCDLALIFPVKQFKFGKRASKAILVNHGNWMNKREKTFVVIGWGFTKENGTVSKVGLQMTSLRYVSPKKCSRLHEGHFFTSDMFCLYGNGKHDVCQGDSGGGVLWNGLLVGLTSHGDGCANEGKPSVFTNVWLLKDWIHEKISQFIDNNCD